MGTQDAINNIIRLVGGEGNINKVWHCMTRLRFDLVDDNKVDQGEIKKLPGVLGAQLQSDQFQIIIGPKVNSWHEQMLATLGGGDRTTDTAPAQKGRKSLVSMFMDTVSGVFGPIVPAIAGAGMIKGLLAGLIALKAGICEKRYRGGDRSDCQRRVLFPAVLPRGLGGENFQNQ